jgi:ubiquinone/menaquinone biosynthesis C-methylase UbiE
MGIDPTAAAGFSAAADVYERARPGYPEAVVTWLAARLGIGPGRDVLDLAAGTGKLTRQLVPLGARIVCVEPLDAMRAELERAVPGVEALAGTAEAIPLSDGSVDAVTCAQAFHWFQPDDALREIHRVLRPGGRIALLWNERDYSDQFHARVDPLLHPHRRELPAGEEHWREVLGTIDDRTWREVLGTFEHRTWRHAQSLTLDEYVDRVASTAFVAAMATDQRHELLNAVRETVAGLEQPFEVRYLTEVYVSKRLRGANPSNEGSSFNG